jgi:hypothetical protein
MDGVSYRQHRQRMGSTVETTRCSQSPDHVLPIVAIRVTMVTILGHALLGAWSDGSVSEFSPDWSYWDAISV